MALKATGNIDLSRTSQNPKIIFSGSSLTNDSNDPYQNYVAYVNIPNGSPNNAWGATFDTLVVGRPAMPCGTMHIDRVNNPKGDDFAVVNPHWNPDGLVNIQVMELGPNDWRVSAGANITPAEVCRRQHNYLASQYAIGVKIVLVGPISCSQGNNIATGDAFKNAIHAYHTATVNGEPRWKQYAHRYVDFSATALGTDGAHADTAHFTDGIHLKGNVAYPYGRALFAYYIQAQLHNLVAELDDSPSHPLKINRFE